MLKVYETLRDFDGMDEGQHFWYFGFGDKQMHAVTDEGDDAERLIKTWLIENTDYVAGDDLYVANDDETIGRLGIMMRTNKTVGSMLDEIVAFIKDNDHMDGFPIDDDWEAGYKRGQRCTSIPAAPRGRDEYHYQCGAVQGMYVRLARMSDASFDFIRSWLVFDKTRQTAIVQA